MEIKRQLKNLDVKISRLAQGLGISRPTLDSYIESYENGQQIPNEKYRKIFDYLFTDDVQSTIEFAKRLDYVKRVFLQTESNEIAESKEQSIRSNISDFAYKTKSGDGFLEFINLLIDNRSVDLVNAISDYFNYVNGFKQYEESLENDKRKALFAWLYKIFYQYNANKIEIDESSYNGFVEKSEKVYKKRISNSANYELLEYLRKNIPEGSNVNMEYIKKLLDKKEN